MDNYAHGGDIHNLSISLGKQPYEILDFSANINPLGPPEWLSDHILEQIEQLKHYPSPYAETLKDIAAKYYGASKQEVLAGNGSTEILYNLPRICSLKKAIIPSPAYVDYERVCQINQIEIAPFPLLPEKDFKLDLSGLEKALATPSLVFLAQPNNPTGQTLNVSQIKNIASNNPQSLFIIDEAFADFIPDLERLSLDRTPNMLILLSLTKFYAIPGLRLGLAIGHTSLVNELNKIMPPWSVNGLAQAVGIRCLKDFVFQKKSKNQVQNLRKSMREELNRIKQLTVFPSKANYFLCRIEKQGLQANDLRQRLLQEDSIVIRDCSNYRGLDERYFRVAVRKNSENQKLISALNRHLNVQGRSQEKVTVSLNKNRKKNEKKTPAIMFQGLSSNAGKSILTAGMCRLLLQEGYQVAPFKAQNMSLNSFVTREGGEIGRAQALQAQACKLEPDVLMNPVLLKPSTDTGSQVIIMGQPVGNMNVQSYIRYKSQAANSAFQAYNRLSKEYDIIVIEGAGSPAEINLKSHDLANMGIARYANSNVLLIGDIDRGGVFASFVGTMQLMENWERDLVSGLVINRFRGDPSLLDSAIKDTSQIVNKPFLGIIPFMKGLDLPEEDSVTFKAGWDRIPNQNRTDCINIACIDLPHISNFTDLDPLLSEPDIQISIIRKPKDLEQIPDVLILPGSKNVPGDLAFLENSGLSESILALAKRKQTEIVGICGGLQILGESIADPLGLESEQKTSQGLNLIPIVTELGAKKNLYQAEAEHIPSSCNLKGYEIHHGATHKTSPNTHCLIFTHDGREIGFVGNNQLIWGTYLHGLFDKDEFRRWFIDRVRQRKGLKPLKEIQSVYDLEQSLDNLAEVIRENLNMQFIFDLIGPK